MAGLVLPEAVTIRLTTPGAAGNEPLRLQGVAFGVRTFGCRKNNYHLGPFFSDEAGVVALTRRALELSASAELESGLMDYGALTECGPEVELRHWTAEEVARAAQSRRQVWTMQLRGEDELYGSLAELVRRYLEAPNSRLSPPTPVRDRWDGSRPAVEYEYLARLVAPT